MIGQWLKAINKLNLNQLHRKQSPMAIMNVIIKLGGITMAMTEFEKKMLSEVKGIRKELHEMNKPVKIDGQVDGKDIVNAVNENMLNAIKTSGEAWK